MRTEIIESKISCIANCVARIETRKNAVGHLDTDLDAQDIIQHNVARAIQCCLDIGYHIIAEKRWGIAKTYSEVYEILARNGAISSDILQTMKNMVVLRNIAIHDYQNLSLDILTNVVRHHLGDFRVYVKQILAWCKAQGL